MNKNHLQDGQISELRKMAQNYKTFKEISRTYLLYIFLGQNLQICPNQML